MADRSLCFCEQRAGLGPIREGQEASHAAGILDVQAEQGWVAEQDRAGFWIEPKLHPLVLGAQFAGEICWRNSSASSTAIGHATVRSSLG